MVTDEEVRLTVPSRPEFLRLARVTAAGLASRLGFSFDEVEDLRLAIDELCYGMTGSQGREGTVQIRYLLSDDRLVVEGEATITELTERAGAPQTELSELSELILGALVDDHEFADGEAGPRFRLVKCHGKDPETVAT